ncbi:hypothetical protein V1478_007775 [Vespula squamosa]|uniref:Uncharacterized protein n=1 Tax=Vespula squamosa TaxID=30214 RepID=A0ABD2AWV5_VESSQ
MLDCNHIYFERRNTGLVVNCETRPIAFVDFTSMPYVPLYRTLSSFSILMQKACPSKTYQVKRVKI